MEKGNKIGFLLFPFFAHSSSAITHHWTNIFHQPTTNICHTILAETPNTLPSFFGGIITVVPFWTHHYNLTSPIVSNPSKNLLTSPFSIPSVFSLVQHHKLPLSKPLLNTFVPFFNRTPHDLPPTCQWWFLCTTLLACHHYSGCTTNNAYMISPSSTTPKHNSFSAAVNNFCLWYSDWYWCFANPSDWILNFEFFSSRMRCFFTLWRKTYSWEV